MEDEQQLQKVWELWVLQGGGGSHLDSGCLRE